MYSGLKIISTSNLTESEPIPFTLLDKFFLLVERLCNEAEIYYYWKIIVKRTREVPSRKVVVIGNTIYIHPAMLVSLRAKIKEFEAI